MRKRHVIFFLASAVSLLPCQRAGAVIEYQAGQGWTVEGPNGEEPTEGTASAQLDKAKSLESAGNYKAATAAYHNLVRKFPRSGVAAQAQFKAALMAEKAGDYDLSYAYLKEYLAKYPKGDDFDNAVATQFDIGQKYLEGARRRLFGVKTFPSMVRAQQIFEGIVSAAPYSKWAPQAQFYAGQALEKQGQPVQAIAAYEEVLSRYPSDPTAADAQYQIGYVHLTAARLAYDKGEANKAREAFEDFLAHYPNSEKAPQAQDNLKSLQGRDTSGAMSIAKYYDKRKNYKAAVIYYNDVIKGSPGTPDAQVAQTRVDALKSQVGDEALQSGPEKAENGARAQEKRRVQAQIDTASRSDYMGPPVAQPTPVPDQVAPPKSQLRSSPDNLSPLPPPVEPELPHQ